MLCYVMLCYWQWYEQQANQIEYVDNDCREVYVDGSQGKRRSIDAFNEQNTLRSGRMSAMVPLRPSRFTGG